MTLLLLGRIEVRDQLAQPLTVQGAKARALLALLLVRANQHVPTDRLEDELWNGAPPRGARSTIQAHVSRLRAVLGAAGGRAALSGRSGGYELQVDPAEVDAHRFEALVLGGSRSAAADPRQAADQLARALDEWRGPALQDVRHLPALSAEAERLDELRLSTIEARASAELDLGGHALVIGSLQRLVDEHPYREQLRALLMLALYRSGRQAEALRAYHAGHVALADIGVRPGPELRALEAAISREAPELRRAAPAGAATGPAPVPHPWLDALEDDRRVVLVEGPDAAGAVELLVEAARRSGRTVLRGRSDAGAARPYHCVADALAPLLGGTVPPALAPIVAAVPPLPGPDLAFGRVEAFEAVLELLTGRSATAPLLLVLEDLDAAGASTADLVEHVARRCTELRLRLVVSRRAPTAAGHVDAMLRRLDGDGLVRRVRANDGRTAPAVPADRRPPGSDHAALAVDAFAQAARLSGRAGDDAMRRLGFDEAADHYRAALTALDLTPGSHTLRRAELQLALGHACHAAYELPEALCGFRRAAALAAELGDVPLLAEAAVGVAAATEYGMADAEIVAVLSGALKALQEDAPLRVELLAGLARTLPGHDPSAVTNVRHAVDLARRLHLPRPLATALATSVLVTWGPLEARSRLTDIDDVIGRAEELGMVELAIEAQAWRAATLDQLGRADEARCSRQIVQRWAEQSRRPFFLAMASMLTIAEHLAAGRSDAAEAAMADLPEGADVSPNFSAAFAAQLYLLRRLQGRVAEFVPLFDLLADQPAPAAWHAARVLALAETGDPAAASLLGRAVATMDDVAEDWLWLATVTLLADACIHLRDGRHAADLHRRLRPHRSETVVIAHGIASLGPVQPRLEALQRLTCGAEDPGRVDEPARV